MNTAPEKSCRLSRMQRKKRSRVQKILTGFGLRSRLLFAFYLVSLVPLVVLFFIQYQITKRNTLNIIETNITQVADVQQRRINLEFLRISQQLRLVASRTQMRISLGAYNQTRQKQHLDLIDRILADTISSMDSFLGVWIRDEEGLLVTGVYDNAVIISPGIIPPIMGEKSPQFDLDWLNDSLPHAWVSGVLALEEEVVGSIHMLVSLASLYVILDDFPCDESGGETLLLLHGNDGMKIVSPLCPSHKEDSRSLYRLLEAGDIYQELVADSQVLTPVRYQDQIVIVRPLDHALGSVVLHVSTDRLAEAFWSQMRLLMLLTLFTAALVMIMSFRLARMIARPLQYLTRIASRLRYGDTDIRITERFWGEFVELTRLFNRAIHMLSRRTGELNREIEARRRSQQKLVDLANTDTLTGLINRRFFMEKLREALSCPARERHPVALLYLDLDEFKPINDRMGHEAGDLVLQIVAGRIRHLLREGDLAARLGGDEFALVLMKNGGQQFDPHTIAQRVEEQLALPMTIKNQVVSVGCSVGVVRLYPGDDPQEVLNRADREMYRTKHARRGGVPAGD